MRKKATDATDNQVNDPEAANVTNDELLELHTAQGNLIAEQFEQIAALKAKLGALEANAKPSAPAPATAPVVKVGGREYRVVHGVSVRVADGLLRNLTPREIAGDTALLKELAAGNSTALQAV